jgi:peroxiredoxin
MSETIAVDSVSVFLDRVWRNLEEPVIQISKYDKNSSFILKPDKYILIIHSDQFDRAEKCFLIPDNNMNININIDSLSSTDQLPIVNVEGFNLNDEYISLRSKLGSIDRKIHSLESSIAKKENKDNIYNSILNELDELQNRYSSYFKQSIIDKKLRRLILCHPVYYQFKEMKKNKTLDSIDVVQFLKSEPFKNFFITHIELLNELDTHSILLNGEFFITILILENILEEIPLEIKKTIISDNFLNDFLNNFIKESSNEYCKQRLLHQGCALYGHEGKIEIAKTYCKWIKKDFPDYLWVKNGHIDECINGLIVTAGTKAPLFELESLSGEKISLSAYQGDYKFIIFFHPNCHVCRQNMVYYNNLHESMIDSNLHVIGIADPNIERLKLFKNNYKVKFPILRDTNRDIFQQYGISAIPSNFLISPTGKILAKNLKSNNLIFLVEKEMKNYVNSK